MFKKFRKLFFLGFFLAGLKVFAVAVFSANEKDFEGLLPSFMLDFTGIRLPAGSSYSLNDSTTNENEFLELSTKLPIYPIFPMYKKGFASSQFIGVKIPAKYLKEAPAERDKNKALSESIFGFRPTSETVQMAMNLIERIRLTDGLRLKAYYHKGEILGVRSDYSVAVYNRTTIGLSFDFGLGPKVINFGNETTYGALFDFNRMTKLNAPTGINLGKSLNDLVGNADLMINGDKAEQLIERTVQFSPYLQNYLIANTKSKLLAKLDPRTNEYASEFNANFELKTEEAPALHVKIPRDAFSKELNNNFTALKSGLKRELEWKKTLGISVAGTLVLKSEEANRFVQTICDYLAQSYEIPREIWPRCRVAATWSPNAYAFPAGDIFITMGLLGMLSDLDSVILVLGHEIGHVVGRHITRSVPAENLYIYTASALGIALNAGLTAFSISGGLGYLGQVNYLSWFPQSIVASMAGGEMVGKAWQIANLAPIAGLMALSRAMEWEADRFGHQAALSVGAKQEILPKGFIEFKDFLKEYFNEPQGLFARLMANHPDWQSRTESLVEKYTDYWKKMEPFNSANRLNDSFFSRYRAIHEELKPGVHRWAQAVREKRLQGNSWQEDHLAMSLQSPTGKCILTALGGGSGYRTTTEK